MSKQLLIIVPGLGDGSLVTRWSLSVFGSFTHISCNVHEMPWKGHEQDFEKKLSRLLHIIDEHTKHGRRVSLLGISAGGSAVLNAFVQRQDTIHKVINICGRLRSGVNVYPSLQQASRRSLSFQESVLLFEQQEPFLSFEQRINVLTVRPVADELVPVSTMTLCGATNVRIISVEHMLSIAAAMTVYSHHIVAFLSKD